VIAEVARRAGFNTGVETSAMAWRQLTDAVPFYAGLTLEEIGGRGVRWPARAEAAAMPSGSPETTLTPPKNPPPNGDLRLGTYRPIWASPEVEISPALHFAIAEQQVELSPEDAARLGIGHGDSVAVASNGARLEARAAVRSGVPAGTAFLADGIASNSANALSNGTVHVEALQTLKIP
jgi:NADH-quinone oxidoreductase subunit G